MGHPDPVLSVVAFPKLDIDYRLVACQDRFRQVSQHINIQQLVEDFNRLRTAAKLQGIQTRDGITQYITRHLDLLSVVEDLDSEREESLTLLGTLVDELYDMEPATAIAS